MLENASFQEYISCIIHSLTMPLDTQLSLVFLVSWHHEWMNMNTSLVFITAQLSNYQKGKKVKNVAITWISIITREHPHLTILIWLQRLGINFEEIFALESTALKDHTYR